MGAVDDVAGHRAARGRRRAGGLVLALNLGLALVSLAAAAACNGRDAWKSEPLPDHGPVTAPAELPADAPRVRLRTDLGDVVIGLYTDRAPLSSANFLRYVESGFYDGTIFHRVVRGNMTVVQGGGFTPDLQAKATREPIANEADNGLSNVRGTVAMARTGQIDSATAQFYFNVTDNLFLDHRGTGPQDYGYAVFGLVVEGMEVVDRISLVPTQRAPGSSHQDVPMDEIVIREARRLQ